MKLFVKALKLLCGAGLLIVAIGGGVGLCVSSPVALKSMIVDGKPVVCPVRGTQMEVPGRIAALIIFGVPLASLLGGYLLLRSAFEEEEQTDRS